MVCQTWSSARLFALAWLAGATAAGTAAAQTSLASQYDFRKFEYPDSALSTPLGINAKREVAGYYTDQAGVDHGYVWSKGKFTTID